MANLLSASIDVSKITKERLIKGKKGNYLNITISVNDQEDQFGNNVSVWEGQSKEEREAKKERNFLGNGRILWSGEQQGQSQPQSQDNVGGGDEADDLPF